MLTVKQKDMEPAFRIMKEAAQWLISKGMPLWKPEDFTRERLLKDISENDIYTAYLSNRPVASMILQWKDPSFWPNAKADSGFIHKLSVIREYAGKGIAQEFINWAKGEVKNRNRTFLRLDCAGDRPTLCKIYEDIGFSKVDRKMVGQFDVAFYELRVYSHR